MPQRLPALAGSPHLAGGHAQMRSHLANHCVHSIVDVIDPRRCSPPHQASEAIEIGGDRGETIRRSGKRPHRFPVVDSDWRGVKQRADVRAMRKAGRTGACRHCPAIRGDKRRVTFTAGATATSKQVSKFSATAMPEFSSIFATASLATDDTAMLGAWRAPGSQGRDREGRGWSARENRRARRVQTMVDGMCPLPLRTQPR